MAPRELAEISVLAADIDRVLAALREARALVERETRGAGGVSDDPRGLAYLAVTLAQYYNALEDALVRSARVFEDGPPAGEAWHAELLRRAALPLPHLRPEILPAGCQEDARTLLRFRHFLRHAYVVPLDREKISFVCAALARLHPLAESGLIAFRNFLERLLAGESSR